LTGLAAAKRGFNSIIPVVHIADEIRVFAADDERPISERMLEGDQEYAGSIPGQFRQKFSSGAET
jgi:hypothetical protein